MALRSCLIIVALSVISATTQAGKLCIEVMFVIFGAYFFYLYVKKVFSTCSCSLLNILLFGLNLSVVS